MNKIKRVQIMTKLRDANPTPKTELNYASTFELLISV
ncbi:MAG: endonuclease-3, partial [Candidatus Azotimanducaceae bacterium]